MEVINKDKNLNEYLLSYVRLRFAIGILGVFLPVILIIYSTIISSDKVLQQSISHYYYTSMHIVFTGILCVLGVFLITYKSLYTDLVRKKENLYSNIAGVAACLVAFFPTGESGFEGVCQYVHVHYALTSWESKIHYVSAAILFLCFALICLTCFTHSDPTSKEDAFKSRRNRIYRVTGWIIFSCVILLFFKYLVFEDDSHHSWLLQKSTFILESIALFAFGTAWLVKGSRVLQNTPFQRLMQWVRPAD